MHDYDVKLQSNGAYWQAWWERGDGSRGVKSLGPKSKYSKRQARALCRDLAITLRHGSQRSTAPKLSEWINRYREFRNEASKATLAIIVQAGVYLGRYFDHDPTIDRITRAEAAEFRAALARGELNIDNERRTEPPRDTTVCKHIRTIKRMFREAEDQDLIIKNPFSRLRSTAAKPVKQWRDIDAADMMRMLDACPNDGWRALLLLCRWCGLRRGEALAAEWGDVLWNLNRINVNAGIDHETTKKHVRICPIEPAKAPTGVTAELLRLYQAAPDGVSRVCNGVVETSVDGGILKIIRAAGVGRYKKPFHTLRKNRVTELAQVYPLYVVTEWLGHDESVAIGYYTKVPDELYESPAAAKTESKTV